MLLTMKQNRLVVEHLTANSKWPKAAPRLWAWLFEFLDPDGTGELLVTREGLTERVKASPRAINGVLAELVEFGALIRLREPEPGKQGRGTVRYFMNPRVGTRNVTTEERAAKIAGAPPLRIIDGGGRRTERRSRAPAPPTVLS